MKIKNSTKKVFVIVIFVLLILSIIGFAIYRNNQNDSNNEPSYNGSASRLSRDVNEEAVQNRIKYIVENQDEIRANSTGREISSFSTKILDDTPARLTNISITCSAINDTIVHKGETFSFNDIVGKPTADKGYKEAKVIIHHEAELGIGGRKLPS